MSEPLIQVVDTLDEIAPQLKFIALAIEAIPEGHEGASTGAASALLRLHGDLLALREDAHRALRQDMTQAGDA
jgi:hypothetical protein